MASSPQINKFIGDTIRRQRLLRNKSLREVGDELGVTFQQMQKYEKGSNRLPSVYLHKIATFLNHPIENFFPKGTECLREAQDSFLYKDTSEHELSNLIKFYSSISSKEIRKKILELLKILAGTE